MRFATFFEERPERQPLALLIYVVSAIAVLGVSFISPILPVMMRALSLTEGQTALVITVYTAPVVVFVPVFGWLSDRTSRRTIVTFGLVVFGVAGSLIFFTSSFRTVLALRIAQGIGFSAMMPLTTALLGDIFRGEAEVGAQGLRVTFISLGASVYPVLGGYLAGRSWRLPFVLFAVAIPLGLLAVTYLPGTTETASRPSRKADNSYIRRVAACVRDPLVAGALGTGFARFFVRYGLWAYLPLLATQRALSPGQVGIVIGAVGAAKMVFASQARRVAAIGSPAILMGAGLLIGSLATTAVVFPTTLSAFLVFGVVFGTIDGIVAPLQKSLVTQRAGKDVRGGLVSANNVLQNAGKTLGPAILGVLAGGMATPQLFLVLGTFGSVAGAGVLLGIWRFRGTHLGDSSLELANEDPSAERQ